jgi:hypothetical protein
MNIASGIPKFVSLSTIQQPDNPYVKADTMYIKIMVDFANLPKTMLPYALSLNPGLPTHCQQQMIQQEIERRAQLLQTNSTSNNGTASNNLLNSNQQQFDGDNTINK